MDFQQWESRNLARSILAQLYSRVIHRYEEDVKKAERNRSQPNHAELPRNPSDAALSSSIHRRFDRRMSRSYSIGTLLDDEEGAPNGLMFPSLKYTAPSRRCSVDDSIAFLPDSPESSDSQASLRRTQSTAALGSTYSLTAERPLWFGPSSVAYY
ncbi:hypothetical protein OSTOST_24760, partial [Ostertagia ostertagi]